MTPSGWHDDACRRDGGHDEMQMAVWLELQRQAKPDPTDELTRSVAVEFPMVRRGSGIVAFADIALLWLNTEDDIKRAVLYELKPKIHSVFGILRQAMCLEKAFAFAYPGTACLVEAIIPLKDPKLPALSLLMPCITWNEQSGALSRYRGTGHQLIAA